MTRTSLHDEAVPRNDDDHRSIIDKMNNIFSNYVCVYLKLLALLKMREQLQHAGGGALLLGPGE